MRVIAGIAKGRQLIAPAGMNTRPITAKIKEALFSILQNQIVNANFLDLFAGSGSIGIEAISRGAHTVVFVEKDRKAVEVIRKNLATCRFTDNCELYQDDVFHRIVWLKNNDYRFDIIYLDPPFTNEKIFLPIMELLYKSDILSDFGVIIIRTKNDMSLPNIIGNLNKFKIKKYGISNLNFYNKTNLGD